MSTALITEGVAGGYGAQVMRPAATQAVTYTASAQSTAFNDATRLVRVIADADVYLLFGANPTATAINAIRVPADTVEYFEVNAGDKVACYDGTT